MISKITGPMGRPQSIMMQANLDLTRLSLINCSRKYAIFTLTAFLRIDSMRFIMLLAAIQFPRHINLKHTLLSDNVLLNV